MSATIDGRPIKDFALVRQCDGCGMTTAADLDATDEHCKQMELPGQSVRRVVLDECLRLWKTAGPCACRRNRTDKIARLTEENDALKARLEAIRPIPPVSDWLANRLHAARFRAQEEGDDGWRNINASLRDWLETFLGESPESDPWKDKRNKV